MSVKVIIKRKLKIDDPEKLIPFLTRLRERAREQPGYISSEVLRNIDHPEDYMVVSRWETAADWEKWFSSKERRAIHGQIDSLIGERTFYDVFEPISSN